MAVKERQGVIGTGSQTQTKPDYGNLGLSSSTSSTPYTYTGTLLDFDVLYGNNRYTGTYNPSMKGGNVYEGIKQDASFVQSAKDLLGQNNNFSLGAAKQAVSGNTSDNPFFGEFFNYYLGLAQQRQETLSKTLQRSGTGNNTAGSALGGSLI